MLFNSIEFLIFIIFVFFVHWYIISANFKSQNSFLLIMSLVFYSAWDYRFLLLIIFSTIIDFFLGIRIEKSKTNKKFFLILSISINLGLLIIFKYFNFFIDSFENMFSLIGFNNSFVTLNIILPVGISFYTFQTLSYSIDIYRGDLKPTKDLVKFATYVTFFPQLVAGPIERAGKILPQLSEKRIFDRVKAEEGLRKILIGFFKKIVIADSLAPIVENIFSNYNEFSTIVLLMGLLFFSFQIYCDFSGYSDIAVGLAKLLGIDLMENFNFPYFAINIGEFWKRWHISLTNWFRDYLYIPIGGSKNSFLLSLRNLSIVFLLSGLWHGANWNYIFWGLIHIIFYIPHFIKRKFSNSQLFFLKIKNRLLSTILTYLIVTLSWVFFRSNSISDAFKYIFKIFTLEKGEINILNPANNLSAYYYIIYIVIFIMVDKYFSLNRNETIVQKRIINLLLVLVILFFAPMNQSDSFIYFQF